MTNEELNDLLNDTSAKLAEHFDAVQILVSWTDDGSTKGKKVGRGNWYARQGMAHEFINQDIADDTANQIASKLNDKPDDGDEWKEPKP